MALIYFVRSMDNETNSFILSQRSDWTLHLFNYFSTLIFIVLIVSTTVYSEIEGLNSHSYSKTYIQLMRIKMYLQVGRMLHAMFILGAFLFYFFANKAIGAFQNNTILWSVVYAYFSLYGFTLLFFSQFDALSRYQNYKMVKDKIYEYGLQERLIKPFVYSRCQREAVLMASVAFDKKMECQKVFKKMGFKWFHILPRVLIRKPSLLFSKKYWSITLFASQYQSRYFLW
jgi:hypothetical protein